MQELTTMHQNGEITTALYKNMEKQLLDLPESWNALK